MALNPAATRAEDHPGHDAASCPLRERVVAHPRGTSQNGYRCAFTSGHCMPGDHCAARVAKAEQDPFFFMEDEV